MQIGQRRGHECRERELLVSHDQDGSRLGAHRVCRPVAHRSKRRSVAMIPKGSWRVRLTRIADPPPPATGGSSGSADPGPWRASPGSGRSPSPRRSPCSTARSSLSPAGNGPTRLVDSGGAEVRKAVRGKGPEDRPVVGRGDDERRPPPRSISDSAVSPLSAATP